VCDEASVPLEIVPLQRQYHDRVVAWAVAELAAGRTPSPDVFCNQRVKFGAFRDVVEEAHGHAFDKIASGHYARLVQRDGLWHLLKGVDPVKDQTYFLFHLDQGQLGRCLFPLGGLHKKDVRALARDFQLPNRDRKDSQGICFLGKLPYDDFVRGYLGSREGEIREVRSGRVLGSHRGYWFHTIGQRKGLGLHGGPWYVVAKNVDENVVFVCHQEDLGAYRRDHLRIGPVHWIAGEPSGDRGGLAVKLRHSPAVYPCRVTPRGEGELDVVLDGFDPGIAAGQWAVLYDGEECLGGGMIAA
jgi:tRNA-specific 2-thiouridylase